MEPKKKQKFTIRVEVLIPATITYQIEAETAAEALQKAEGSARQQRIDIHHNKRRKINAKVYRINTTMLQLTKSYR